MLTIIPIILTNLSNVGIGMLLFLAVYLSNMGLGAWHNVKLNGYDFDWKLILQSFAKFAILGLSIAVLSMAVSVIPVYVSFIGIDIAVDVLASIDAIVIIGAFLTATIKYAAEAIGKLKNILGIGDNKNG